MKKEEIDDRLMDSLLRGKSEVNLASEVENQLKPQIKTRNWKRSILAIAAMAMFGALVSVGLRNEKQREQEIVLTSPKVDAEAQLAALDAEIEAQQDRVDQKRKVLDTIARVTGRPYLEGTSNLPESREQTQAISADRDVFSLKKQKKSYEGYLEKFDTLDNERLLAYAAELPVADNGIKQLQRQRLNLRRKADALKASGLADNHPDLRIQKRRLETLNKNVEVGLSSLRENLQTNRQLIEQQLTGLENISEDRDANLVKLSTEIHDYDEAQRQYESELALLQNLKLQHSSERVRLRAKPEQPPAEAEPELLTQIEAASSQTKKQNRFLLESTSGPNGTFQHGDNPKFSRKISGESPIVVEVDSKLFSELETPASTPISSTTNILPQPPQTPKLRASKVKRRLLSTRKPSTDFSSEKAGFAFGADDAFSESPQRTESRFSHERGRLTELALIPEQNERYDTLTDQTWKTPLEEALSTFSIDVDTASYTNLRRLIREGSDIPADAVRVEELVNYFDYSYPQPEKNQAFGVGLKMATCPWEEKHHLVRVALQGQEIDKDQRGDANLVFLIDVSGSMQDSDKLPLLVQGLQLLVEELRENDRVAIVVYASNDGVVLEPTKMGQGGREVAMEALGRLRAGGSTNGGAGIKRAYEMAQQHFVKGGINRVILATDGDFNVGTTNNDELVKLVKEKAKAGVFLSVCGFGRGNLNDSMLEAITNDGNGVYYYIDSFREARRVFLEGLMGTLVTIAKDVKIQVEFNPAKVAHYRPIGYANRILKKEDFNNDQVDAGDIGAGHQVTAFYEVVPTGIEGTIRPKVDALKYQAKEPAVEVQKNDSNEWMTVKLRHKKPDADTSELQTHVLEGKASPWAESSADFRFASGVALWGMTLRETEGSEEGLPLVKSLIQDSLKGAEKREEFSELLKKGIPPSAE